MAGRVALIDRTPSAAELTRLAGELDTIVGLVVWAPDWDENAAAGALAAHGFEHGVVTVAPGEGALCVLGRDDAAAEQIDAALSAPQRPFRVLAMLPTFNESDIISPVLGALISGGVDVYMYDHRSTDDTVARARPWIGRGLVHIESFPDEAGYPARNRDEMVWRDILRRAQDISRMFIADWYMFTNADEFRESPWPQSTLADGLREVDELGYNAVNFELYNFRPTDNRFRPGDDPRAVLLCYEDAGVHDLLQIKAWKRQPCDVDLVSNAGHDVLFDGKRVFPLSFILRHYPIRSAEHGRRKVQNERKDRFAAEERAVGMHIQYDAYGPDCDYLHDPATLSVWDGNTIRAGQLAQATRDLLLVSSLTGRDATLGDFTARALTERLQRRGLPADVTLGEAVKRIEHLSSGRDDPSSNEVNVVADEFAAAVQAQARLRGNLRDAAVIGDIRAKLRS